MLGVGVVVLVLVLVLVMVLVLMVRVIVIVVVVVDVLLVVVVVAVLSNLVVLQRLRGGDGEERHRVAGQGAAEDALGAHPGTRGGALDAGEGLYIVPVLTLV